ncbi:hypothetical protein BCD64_16025 [Nostoc sp. MBR 210]|uniref:Uncharacterized protein n=1 Tax=Nostoc spongiaeforme FACHB-130 TaxID=1357510 RepID=A0ABR8FYS3_9NOSO|nr:hypothetical protein [Nostoc spongiaeforme]MBD2596298.1 hypothetical protein [Nostoc spongiaeforme FACHB-130]OCQ97091.1 hypothetical protein BCD64_16025 [Nostoc sp. MBR 210]
MNQMPVIVTIFITYFLMTCYFFGNWLRFSLRHPASSPEDKFLSLLVSLITTIFWPLVIPLSCWQILKKRKLEFNHLIPVILVMFAFSISYYLTYVYQ